MGWNFDGFIAPKNVLCRVEVKDIAFLNALFEWFHDLAVVRTRDNKKGLIELWVSPYFYSDVMDVIVCLVDRGFISRLEILGELGNDWTKK